MQRIHALPDAQLVDFEAQIEAQMVASLQAVMDKIAARIERIQVASGVLVAVATTGPTGDDLPEPMDGELAIPAPEPDPISIPPAEAGAPPGQPYISPDDLASITPLWQEQVTSQVLPIVAQVFMDAAGGARAQMLNAVTPGAFHVPLLGSQAAEAYLARATNTFEQVGDHLWATARAQLSEGFEAGESIPQLAARLQQSAGLSARTGVLVARTQIIEASNAGSIAMARVSGLEMQKEWLCVAAGTVVAAIQPLEVVERRRSAGWLATLRTNDGRLLTVTPNHPVLTDRGWIRAHSLHVGDNLVCHRGVKLAGVDDPAALDRGLRSFGDNPDVEHVPVQIDQVFRALAQDGARRGMMSSATDLYSDPVDCEVEIVAIDSDLTSDVQAALGEPGSDSVFTLTDTGLGNLAASGAFREIAASGAKSAVADLGGHGFDLPFALHGSAFSLVAHFPGCALAPDRDAPLNQDAFKSPPPMAIALAEHVERVTLDDVELDQLVDVEIYWAASRHNVYDLTTDRGWFTANGIVVHNSTPDLRTRPTHLAADGQRVDLGEKFTVGGHEADFPADPELPPVERYSCFPTGTPVLAADVRRVYRYWYEGDLVEITDGEGLKLSGTPNHPVLTDRGWIGLGDLLKSDKLVGHSGHSHDTSNRHDVDAMPAKIEQLFDAAEATGLLVRVAGLAVDFHGDRPQRDVDVVAIDGHLRNGVDSSVDDLIEDFLFPTSDESSGILSTDGRSDERFVAASASAHGVMGSTDQSLTLALRRPGHAREHGSTAPAALDVTTTQEVGESAALDARLDCQRLLGLAGQVALNKIIAIRRIPWSGHVFNLETSTGAYVAGYTNTVVQNCRCAIGYVMPDSAVDKMRENLRRRQELEELPGTEGPLTQLFSEPSGPFVPALAVAGPGVRSVLTNASTLREVDQAAMAEARRITGRDIRFDQAGADVQIAREHAEGILRGLERFPESPLSQVGTYGPGSSAEAITRARGVPDFDEPKAFTATLPGNDVVLFNVRMASDPEAYAAALARGHGARWHAQGTATPMGQALHEFGHTVDETFTAAGAKVGAVRAQITEAFTGRAYKAKIREDIGRYAATSTHELGGEAFADVMINGDLASATSRAVFDAIESGYATRFPRAAGEVLPKPAGPGIDLPARGEHVPSYVRPSLAGAKTPRQLRRAWQDEVEAVTGFPFYVDAMPRGISMVTAREYAEGTLQMFEQFPAARMDRIHWFDDAAGPYARIRTGGHAIEINMRYASETARPKLLTSRRKDVAGWDTGTTSWSVRNDVSPQGVIYHEFTHILDEENLRRAIHPEIKSLLIRHAQREGVTDIDDLIKRRISSYATENYHEMIAEAGTDVMVNGAAASQLSRDIVDLLRAEYRRKGFAVRSAPLDELAVEAERAGQIFQTGATPGWSPGRWRAAPLDQARKEIADHEYAVYRASQEQFGFDVDETYGRQLGEGIARQEVPDTARAFQNGDLVIVNYAPGEISEDAFRALVNQVDALQEATPLTGQFIIRIGKPTTTGASSSSGDALSVTRKAMSMDRENPGARYFMPSAAEQPEATYTVTHEYGHSVMFQHGDGPRAMRLYDELELKRLDDEGHILPGRSVGEDPYPGKTLGYYGAEDYKEAYAEAFAEWNLSAGLTENPMVLRYAQEFQWGDPLAEIGQIFPKAAGPRSVSSMTVADLRAELKARGAAIPAGARKADLVRLVEDQRRLPTAAVEVPAPVAAPALTDLMRETPVSVRPLPGGITAKVDELTYRDGMRAVRKDYSRQGSIAAKVYVDAEDLSADVLRVIGVRAPAVARISDDTILMDFVEGTQGGITGELKAPTAIVRSDEGRRLGLADALLGHRDRGGGNWIKTPDGHIVAIDNGAAFEHGLQAAHGNPFASYIMGRNRWVDRIELPPGVDLVEIRAGLQALRPKFAALGRTRNFDEMMARLDEIEARAVRSPVAVAPVSARLATMRVGELRDLARARGIPDAAKLRKAELVKALESPTVPRAAEVVAPLDEKALVRAAARERNKLIESSQATARLLATVDELVAKGAGKAAIAQRLDPALLASEQEFAGADAAVAKALRDALETGDTAKLRSAITRSGTKAKIKPVSKAGAKAKFDPETMDVVGGVDIPKGAQVVVVRRGSTLTLPDGEVMALTKPQVTLAAAPKPIEVVGRVVPGPGYERRIADLEDLKTKIPTKPPRQLGGGSTSDVSLITHGDTQVVEKVYGRRVPGKKAEIAKEVDAEELGPLVVESFGVRSAATIKTGADRVLMEFVDGETIAEKAVGLDLRELDRIARTSIDSDEGRLMGLADFVMGNTDRNEGNWLITTVDGKRELVAIDHGYAFNGLRGLEPPAGFFGEFLQDPAAGYALRAQVDVNPADLRVVRARLETLRQRFVESGRKTWHDGMMRRLRALEQRADPTAPVRLAEAAEEIAAPTSTRMTAHEFRVKLKAAVKNDEALRAAPVGRVLDRTGGQGTVWRGMDDFDARQAVDDYTGNDFQSVNDALRGKIDASTPEGRIGRDLVTDIDRAFGGSRLAHDAELWRSPGSGRGIFGDPSTWGDDLAGFEWIDPAYSSTSASRQVADRFAVESGVRFRVYAPKGTKAIQLSEMPSPGPGVMLAEEGEMLLARGARFRVIKDNGWTYVTDRFGQKIRIRDLDIEVTTQSETPALPWETK